ncbi:hypothetical protein Poly41_10500 [Novipirellula artificiosorum]|uniref:Uncharacterized protein n=1 Tax=Novipirellula artificiosorum TaxID=2528016 RepID=A0A5C6E1I2_9BACT|nr:hypothetical protein Poly41_10500 [Novipirellula artificiosorum]
MASEEVYHGPCHSRHHSRAEVVQVLATRKTRPDGKPACKASGRKMANSATPAWIWVCAMEFGLQATAGCARAAKA